MRAKPRTAQTLNSIIAKCGILLLLLAIAQLCTPAQAQERFLPEISSRTRATASAEPKPATKPTTPTPEPATTASQLRGWKSLVFLCQHDTEDLAQVEICNRTTTNIRFLSAASRVPLQIITGWSDVLSRDKTQDELGLFVSLTATTAAAPSAVHAEVVAAALLPTRVAQSTTLKPVWANRVLGGYVPLWTRASIGATKTARAELVTPLVGAIEENLKNFLAEYLEVNAKN